MPGMSRRRQTGRLLAFRQVLDHACAPSLEALRGGRVRGEVMAFLRVGGDGKSRCGGDACGIAGLGEGNAEKLLFFEVNYDVPGPPAILCPPAWTDTGERLPGRHYLTSCPGNRGVDRLMHATDERGTDEQSPHNLA